MRIAALDLGSNSFHLLIVDTRPDGSFVPIVREKEMLRLGDVVASEGILTEEAIVRATDVVRRFRVLAETNGVDEIVAYGTAALREAKNGAEATEQIEADAGLRIQVVNGIKEAQLVFQAVRASVLMDPGPVLCADLGGGSLELAVGDRQSLQYATSLHLGVGRLTTELVRADPPSQKDRARLDKRVRSEIEEVLADILARGPRQLIGSSGTLCAINRAASARRDGTIPASVNQLSSSAADVHGLAELVFSLSVDERAALPGIDARRAELLPAGIVVAEALLELTGIEVLTTSEWALREGMVLRVINKRDRAELGSDPRAIRFASVLSLCRRSNFRERHARSVARMAVELFEATRPVHGGSGEDREILELAALCHDIGDHVSRDGHSRHSAYLIENGGLRGFSPTEVAMLVCLARYHTRGKPRESFPTFDSLGEQDRGRLLKLLALLRIADGLDVSHADIIGPLSARILEGAVVIEAPARGDAELEHWMFQRKRPLFAEVFGKEAVLDLHRVGHDEFEPDSSAVAAEAAGHG